jgi:hypothetical protein
VLKRKLNAEHRGRRDSGEKSRRALMAAKVGEHCARVKHRARDRQHPQYDIRRHVDRKQDLRERRQTEQLAGDREHAGRHHHREVRRVQVLERGTSATQCMDARVFRHQTIGLNVKARTGRCCCFHLRITMPSGAALRQAIAMP